MALVTPDQVSPGDEITADSVNTPIGQLADEINGGLDDDNISGFSGTKIADGTVTNAKLSTTAGEIGGASQSWPVSWTNVTVGAGGSVTPRYIQTGKRVRGNLTFIMGTGSAISGLITFSLPVTARSLPSITLSSIGDATILDAGSTVFFGKVVLGSTTTATLVVANVASTYPSQTNTSSTVPMTWSAANGDGFYLEFEYEAA